MKGGKTKMTENQEQGQEKEVSINSWDGFTGTNFLKAEHLESNEDTFVCKKVSIDEKNQRPRLTLEKDGDTYEFDLNVTNSNTIRDLGVKAPKDLMGKMITFVKVYRYSPKEKKDVESLGIKTVSE